MNTRTLTLALSSTCLGLALWGSALPAAHADFDDHDHEMARQALQQGKVLPLRTVLDKVEKEYSGQVVELEFESERGQFVYDIRLLQTDGTVLKIKMDAVDGKVIYVQQRRKH